MERLRDDLSRASLYSLAYRQLYHLWHNRNNSWLTPVILAFRKLNHESYQDSEASLGNRTRHCLKILMGLGSWPYAGVKHTPRMPKALDSTPRKMDRWIDDRNIMDRYQDM